MASKHAWGRGWWVVAAVAVILVASYVVHTRSQKPESRTDTRGAATSSGADDQRITIETLPPRRFAIIDNHEHILDEQQARRVLAAMDQLGIRKMALMGTSKYTFTLSKRYGFEGFREHNEEILRLAKKWPDRFLAFPTIRPGDEDNLELLQGYVARGAAGLKLYLGHGASTGKEPFHRMPLDDPRMKPIWRYVQEVQLPLSFHVNLTKYYDEFVRMMEEFPYMRVCILHYGLYKNTPERLARLGALLDRYPNVYSDVGFGAPEFQIEGFAKYDKYPKRYREFLIRYSNRFMFSTDMVVEQGKDDAYIINTLRSYLQTLEMDRYRFFLKPERLWRGMSLPQETLRAIYEETPRRFLLLDEQGLPPDRSHGWPWPGWERSASMPGLPPAVRAVTPLPPGTRVVGQPPVGGPSAQSPLSPRSILGSAVQQPAVPMPEDAP